MFDMDVGGGLTHWESENGNVFADGEKGALEDVLVRLNGGLGLRGGQMPKGEHEHWKNILGLDEPKVGTPAVNAAKPGLLHPALAKTASAVAARASAPASPRYGLGRPDRAGKKRRYDDSSFDGYAQTFEEDRGYSTGGTDDRRGSASKRPRVEGNRKVSQQQT